MFKIHPDSKDLIFKRISKGKAVGGPVKSRCRTVKVCDLGELSMAANNKVNDKIFQRHGRWKSVQAKDTYVDDDLAQHLDELRSLGL